MPLSAQIQERNASTAIDDFRCYIRRLPFDMFSAILELVHEDHRDTDAASTSGFVAEDSCAGVFCRVDKHWRNVALETPGLWTKIIIIGPRTIERANTWLEHSKASLLSVKLLPDATTMGPALALLRPHLYRVEHLKIDCAAKQTALPWSPDTELPNLVSLDVNHVKLSGAIDAVEFLLSVINAQRIAIRHSEVGTAGFSGEEGSLPSTSRWRDSKVFPNLQELSVPGNLLGVVVVAGAGGPALTSFCISGPAFEDSTPNHIVYKSWPLDPNDLSSDFGNASSLYVMLPALSSVKSLTIVASLFVNDVLDRLSEETCQAFDPEPTFVLPRLHTLRVKDCSSPPLAELRALLCPRYRGISSTGTRLASCPLQRIEIVGDMRLPRDWEEAKGLFEPMGTIMVDLTTRGS